MLHSNNADKSESETISFHVVMHFGHKSSILKNGDLADGIHLENRPKELLSSEIEDAE